MLPAPPARRVQEVPRGHREGGAEGAGCRGTAPTSASWLNQIERWFAEITARELVQAIEDYLAVHNEDPKQNEFPILQPLGTASSMLENRPGKRGCQAGGSQSA